MPQDNRPRRPFPLFEVESNVVEEESHVKVHESRQLLKEAEEWRKAARGANTPARSQSPLRL
jgi:hypothetical protein